MVLRGPEGEEMTGGSRELHRQGEERHNFYSSPHIIRKLKSTNVRWARHTERMGDVRNGYKF
jgi:hypothetical protein